MAGHDGDSSAKPPLFFNIYKPERWPEFLEDLTFRMDGRAVLTNVQKRGILMDVVCAETKRKLREWLHPRTLMLASYEEMIELLTTKLKPAVNKGVLFNQFVLRFQRDSESGSDFMAALGDLAENLAMGWHSKQLILYQFKRGIRDRTLQERLYADNEMDCNQALEMVTAAETSKQCVEAITPGCEVMAIMNRSKPHNFHHSKQPPQQSYNGSSSKLFCFRCGENHMVANCTLKYNDCRCSHCNCNGHLLKACQKVKKGKPKPKFQKKSRTNFVDEGSETNFVASATQARAHPTSQSTHSISIRGCFEDDEVFVIETNPRDPPLMLTLNVNNVPVPFLVDNGAGKSLMARASFIQLFNCEPQLQFPAPSSLYTWGAMQALPQCAADGIAMVSVEFGSKQFTLPLVIKDVDPHHAPNLLGRNWLNALYGKDFLHKALQIDKYSVNLVDSLQTQVKVTPANLKSWVYSFPAVNGNGTGLYKGKPIHLNLLPDAVPGYHRARPIPFALTAKYEEAVQKNILKKIWVPIETAQSASAVVPVPRKKGELRLCADYRATLNPYLVNDTYTSPTTDEVLASAAGATLFAELDCREAYLQIPVDYESSMHMVVNTKLGLFRPTTLQFGVKSAPAIFQRIIDGLLAKQTGIKAYQDNIYVFATSFQQLVDRLRLALSTLSKAGIRLNDEKCTWCTDELNILGYRVDKDGIHPTEEKLAAIIGASPPCDVTSLRSLLGFIEFQSRFLNNKATILEPLHRLLDIGVPFKWEPKHQRALDSIKSQLRDKPILQHYSLEMPVSLICDASPYGVGAVLAHSVPQADGTVIEKPVMFASRTLTSAERNYSQIDKEALAIIFGITRFPQYLFGRSFTIYTDHKPLVSLFNPNASLPEQTSPRMLRWALKLASMEYTIKHRPGKQMGTADFLSRCPLPGITEGESSRPAGIFLLEEGIDSFITSKVIASATNQDPVLRKIVGWVKNGWPTSISDDVKPYATRRNALSIMDDCLLWGDRVVVPPALQEDVLRLVHSLHLGIDYSKAVARSLIWWPSMDKDITDTCNACVPCRSQARRAPKAAVTPWPPASAPWERVHLDYASIEGHNVLIFIDAYSKYPVIKKVADLTAKTLITHTRYFFADYGLPELFVSDNGPQLVSHSFEEFLKQNGVRHITSPPYHPASNGLAERTVQTFKNMFKKFQQGDVHARIARSMASMRFRISRTTGKSPAELIGRPGRHHLQRLHPGLQPARPSTCSDKFPLGSNVQAFCSRVRSWRSGVVEAQEGHRVVVVRLEDGSQRRFSPDDLLPRFEHIKENEVGRPDVPCAYRAEFPGLNINIPVLETPSMRPQDLPQEPPVQPQDPPLERQAEPPLSPPIDAHGPAPEEPVVPEPVIVDIEDPEPEVVILHPLTPPRQPAVPRGGPNPRRRGRGPGRPPGRGTPKPTGPITLRSGRVTHPSWRS